MFSFMHLIVCDCVSFSDLVVKTSQRPRLAARSIAANVPNSIVIIMVASFAISLSIMIIF